MTKRTSALVKYLPDTWIFELDYLDYIEEALNEGKYLNEVGFSFFFYSFLIKIRNYLVFEVEAAMRDNLEKKKRNETTKKFILKSSMTNKGNDILIFDCRSQLVEFFQDRVDESEDETLDLREWVIQEYLERPLQLKAYDNRKFHLRVYVLAVGDLAVYVYEDILALFCLDTYKPGGQVNDTGLISGSDGMKSHITNTCYQLDNLPEGADIAAAEGYLKKLNFLQILTKVQI